MTKKEPMRQVSKLIHDIKSKPGCMIESGVSAQSQFLEKLPSDLQSFYGLCAGCSLFNESTYCLRVLRVDEIRPANEEIFARITSEGLTDEIRNWVIPQSRDWMLLAEGENLQFISIDINTDRFGYCYDSFYDVHPNDSILIASSFTEFLERYLASDGKYLYWTKAGFSRRLAKDL